ncbi:histidinol-phosphatase [bacterium]|nr:histidinol-phosphatase [bacterium]
MQIKSDLHLHSALCGHAVDMPVDYAMFAEEKGFKELGFTDHLPACDQLGAVHSMSTVELGIYHNHVMAVREQYPELLIHFGVEADVYTGFEKHLGILRKNYKFDYVIGSIHYVLGQFLFDPNPPETVLNNRHRYFDEYFDLLEMGICSGFFEIVGHIDGIKWLYPQEIDEINSRMTSILDLIAKKGLAMELNTSGLRKLPGSPYPELAILREAGLRKIPVTVGSDAHSPDQVGMDFDKAVDMLVQTGYLYIGRHKNGFQVFLQASLP